MTPIAPSDNRTNRTRPKRLLDFRSGGWLFILMFAICVAFAARIIIPAYETTKTSPGDGVNPATYRFNLESDLIDVSQIQIGTKRRDYIRPLNAPPVITAASMDFVYESHRRFMQSEEGRKGFLLPNDRVIGVTLNGESRAYPRRILNWHEIVNDTLGGRPILVTYHPICDSAVVFDRVVDGEPAEFHVSGLLYNYNLLMYIPRPELGESLWSQMGMRAVTGEAAAAGQRLEVLPSQVVRWADWRERHPDTTVLFPDEDYRKKYKTDPYRADYGTDILRFPLDPMPPEDGPPLRARVIALGRGGDWTPYLFSDIRSAAGEDEVWETQHDGAVVTFTYHHDDPATVALETEAGPGTAHAFWFVWYAFHPESLQVAQGR